MLIAFSSESLDITDCHCEDKGVCSPNIPTSYKLQFHPVATIKSYNIATKSIYSCCYITFMHKEYNNVLVQLTTTSVAKLLTFTKFKSEANDPCLLLKLTPLPPIDHSTSVAISIYHILMKASMPSKKTNL